MDERFALHNVLFDCEDTHRYITSLMQHEFDYYKDTPIKYNSFYGDETALTNIDNDETDADKAMYDFSDIVKEVNETNPMFVGNPDYNDPKSHFNYIDATLTWSITTPQLITNRIT